MALPAFAVVRFFGTEVARWIGGGCLTASIFTFLAYWKDKHLARANASRIPEKTLHVMELLGGWPGAFLAQRVLRHKSAKGTYQFLATDALLGWPLLRLLAGAVSADR